MKSKFMEEIVPMGVVAMKKQKEDVNVTRVEPTVGSTLFDEITEPTACELILPYGTVRPALAKAIVYPFGDGLSHSVPLHANHLRVSVEKVYDDHQSFLISVQPTEDIYNLGKALHSFIQWPRDSISVIKKDKRLPTKPPPKPAQTAPIPSQRVQKDKRLPTKPPPKPAQTVLSQRVLGDQGQQNKKYQTMRKTVLPKKLEGIESLSDWFMSQEIHESFSVVCKPGMFRVESTETYINSKVIIEMLKHEQLDISCIIWYQVMLYSIMLEDSRSAFINPEDITSDRCKYTDKSKTNYVKEQLVDAMNFHQDKLFLLAPYWEEDHWMLFVICPRECTTYILDSNRGVKSLKDYTVIKHVEMAVAAFNKKSNKSRSSRMTWILPKLFDLLFTIFTIFFSATNNVQIGSVVTMF